MMAGCDDIENELTDALETRQGILDELDDPGLPPSQRSQLRALLKAIQHNIGAIKLRLNACRNTVNAVFDLNGIWASGGIAGPVISAASSAITVDMSAYHRPAAHGSIIDSSTISITFPDDATYTGKLILPNKIQWSNNSTWTKLIVATVPFVFGDDPATAEREIRQAGLIPTSTISGRLSGTPLFVTSQIPLGGTTVPVGSIVHVTLIHLPQVQDPV